MLRLQYPRRDTRAMETVVVIGVLQSLWCAATSTSRNTTNTAQRRYINPYHELFRISTQQPTDLTRLDDLAVHRARDPSRQVHGSAQQLHVPLLHWCLRESIKEAGERGQGNKKNGVSW